MSRAYTHGARLLDDGLTQFRLWAPNAETVAVEFANGDIHPLQAGAQGWYEIRTVCAAGTRYRFIIDNRLRVPDPASRYQPEGVHGYSQVVDHDAWRWSAPAWPSWPTWKGRPWHESVIYEAHVGLLDGFQGLKSRLGYLQDLGVTAVELMPLAEFPGQRNWGYDGVHLFAPHHSYGSPDELKSLVEAAHACELMVYVDVVYNHFGPDGNYLHEYAREFFREDIPTPWGAAIDFGRAEVRDFFIENALMWLLDYRVDGLRLDAVHAIFDRDFLHEFSQRVRQAVEPGRHVHLILENEHNTPSLLESGFDAQWNDDGHHVLHTILTGESDGYYADFAQDSTYKLARFLEQGFVFQGDTTIAGVPRGQPSAHLPPTAFVLFLQNHDQIGNRAFGERIIALADEDRLGVAVALMLLCPMVPMLFMGEEQGSRQPFLYFTDHQPELAEAVREGRRAEFSRFPQFSADPRSIPDPNDITSFERSRPAAPGSNDESWHEFYRKLLSVRRAHIMPWLDTVSSNGTRVIGPDAVRAGWLLAGKRELYITLNLGSGPAPMPELQPDEQPLFAHGMDAIRTTLPPGCLVATLRTPDTSTVLQP